MLHHRIDDILDHASEEGLEVLLDRRQGLQVGAYRVSAAEVAHGRSGVHRCRARRIGDCLQHVTRAAETARVDATPVAIVFPVLVGTAKAGSGLGNLCAHLARSGACGIAGGPVDQPLVALLHLALECPNARDVFARLEDEPTVEHGPEEELLLPQVGAYAAEIELAVAAPVPRSLIEVAAENVLQEARVLEEPGHGRRTVLPCASVSAHDGLRRLVRAEDDVLPDAAAQDDPLGEDGIDHFAAPLKIVFDVVNRIADVGAEGRER